MERAKGIESDSANFSGWTTNADSETLSSQNKAQPNQEQDVTEIPGAGTLTPASVSMSDQTASENRILTEQKQNTRQAHPSLLPPDLAELVTLWPRLTSHVKDGLVAMAKATAKAEYRAASH